MNTCFVCGNKLKYAQKYCSSYCREKGQAEEKEEKLKLLYSAVRDVPKNIETGLYNFKPLTKTDRNYIAYVESYIDYRGKNHE